jgi:phosphoenolpyruvate carboxykinase (ATP)
MDATRLKSSFGIENHGLHNIRKVHWNHNTAMLYEHVITNQEGHMAHLGPLIVRTGQHTGRAAKDKFIVEEDQNKDFVWWGPVNKPFTPEHFDLLFKRCLAYLQGRDLYVQDLYAGYDSEYRLPIRVITETAWHSLFARNMFILPKLEEYSNMKPEFTVLHVPNFEAIPEIDGTKTGTFIILNLKRKMVLIGGTAYAGEIKKSIFTIMNFILPQKKVLSMHCSANVGKEGDTALFFGLSGTGKTTLSTDPARELIGDDEHGWNDNGVFNFEGGCYAKVINLSEESEPEIYQTTRRYGTVLENVAYDVLTRKIDLDDDSLTENTRAAYPLTHISNAKDESSGGHPKNIIMLTCDAFGVLPPISKLSPEQAMYHFLSGYTAKVAGTEAGVKEPSATFSTCFGAPFMVLHPLRYGELLAEKIKRHEVNCWLVNTGWTGGPYGQGERMSIKHTRAMLDAIFDGSLATVDYEHDPAFGLSIPKSCPNVPEKVLHPRDTWSDKDAYDAKAKELISLFEKNFKQFEEEATEAVRNAGPRAAVGA